MLNNLKERQTPIVNDSLCPHFGTCGNCTHQHLDNDIYKTFKKNLVVEALKNFGISDIFVKDPIILPPHNRRRISLKAIKTYDGVCLGYNQRKSHNVVDIITCPLVVPEIEAFISPLRDFLKGLLKQGQKAEIFVTNSDVGLDVLLCIENMSSYKMETLEKLAEFAHYQNLARLSFRREKMDEPVVILRKPVISYGGILVESDPSGFLQVSSWSDKILSAYIIANIPKGTQKAADLFCGRGAFTIPLAQRSINVDAFEADPKALEALKKVTSSSFKTIRVFNRNLFSDPLIQKELNSYGYVVVNPPRIGAKSQCIELGKSDAAVVSMVYCDPRSFSRDASILIKNGYRLEAVTPVDQFLWSAHVEVVGTFYR